MFIMYIKEEMTSHSVAVWLKKYHGDALSRQLREAVLIVNNTGMSLIDKNEWVRPAHVGVRGSQV